jgi:hypothetical protein
MTDLLPGRHLHEWIILVGSTRDAADGWRILGIPGNQSRASFAQVKAYYHASGQLLLVAYHAFFGAFRAKIGARLIVDLSASAFRHRASLTISPTHSTRIRALAAILAPRIDASTTNGSSASSLARLRTGSACPTARHG